MMGEDKCPFCGAERGKEVVQDSRTGIPLSDLVWFSCGSIKDNVRGAKCYEAELTALTAEREKLREVLSKLLSAMKISPLSPVNGLIVARNTATVPAVGKRLLQKMGNYILDSLKEKK